MSGTTHPITVRLAGAPYSTTITGGPHRLVSDEPVDLGGTDAGPTPTELLLGALGACTAITVRMVADRKGWPLDAIDVALDYVSRERGRTVISRVVTLEGALDEAQRASLLEIANKCPVHRMLEGEVVVETALG